MQEEGTDGMQGLVRNEGDVQDGGSGVESVEQVRNLNGRSEDWSD